MAAMAVKSSWAPGNIGKTKETTTHRWDRVAGFGYHAQTDNISKHRHNLAFNRQYVDPVPGVADVPVEWLGIVSDYLFHGYGLAIRDHERQGVIIQLGVT